MSIKYQYYKLASKKWVKFFAGSTTDHTWLVATTVMTRTFPKAPTKTMIPNTRGTKIVVNSLTR